MDNDRQTLESLSVRVISYLRSYRCLPGKKRKRIRLLFSSTKYKTDKRFFPINIIRDARRPVLLSQRSALHTQETRERDNLDEESKTIRARFRWLCPELVFVPPMVPACVAV